MVVEENWYLAVSGKKQGPYPRAEIALKVAQSELGPESLVWKEGMEQPKKIRDLPEFFSLPPHLSRRTDEMSALIAVQKGEIQTRFEDGTGGLDVNELKKAKKEAAPAARIASRESGGLQRGFRRWIIRILFLLFAVGIVFFFLSESFAAPPSVPATPTPRSEKLDVDSLKNKYWTRGDEGELRVVQNRLYSKEQKLELALFGGNISTDPFLSVKNVGGGLAFHLNEYFGVGITAWKSYVSPSAALTVFEQETNTTTNSNYPRYFIGGELALSPIYGKLSLLGLAIIHYDMHLLGGAGATYTESGAFATPLLGIGQQVYLSKYLSLRLDFRTTYYRETVLQKFDPTRRGEILGTRNNFSSVLTLGFTFLLGFFS